MRHKEEKNMKKETEDILIKIGVNVGLFILIIVPLRAFTAGMEEQAHLEFLLSILLILSAISFYLAASLPGFYR